MSDEGAVTTVEVGGMSVTSNTGASSEEITEALTPDEQKGEEKDEKPDLSKSASEMGKKGGEAAAKKRAAEAKEAKADPEAAEGPEKPTAEPTEAQKADSEAEVSEEDKEEAEAASEGKEKRKRDARTRVLEATRQAAEAKRERDAATAENARLRAEFEALKKPEPAPTPEAESFSGPKPDDYQEGEHEKYLHDLLKWNREQVLAEVNQQREVEAADQEVQRQAVHFGTVLEKAGMTQENLEGLSDEVLQLSPMLDPEPGQAPDARNCIANELFLSAELAPALMLHLSEHPDVFQRIAALPNPRAVSREMAKIEARLEAATQTGPSAKPKEEVSKAKPPVTPVSGAPYVADDTDVGVKPGETFDDWAKRTKQKIR